MNMASIGQTNSSIQKSMEALRASQAQELEAARRAQGLQTPPAASGPTPASGGCAPSVEAHQSSAYTAAKSAPAPSRHDSLDQMQRRAESHGLSRVRPQADPQALQARQARALQENFQNLLSTTALQNPEQLRMAFQMAFGNKVDGKVLDQLMEQAAKGQSPMPANVRFVEPQELQGASGAYSSRDGGTIYLDASLLHQKGPEGMQRLKAAFTEEMGHHLDRVLGGPDSKGDEGEIFQKALTAGASLTLAEIQAIRTQSDKGTLLLDGKKVQVEFQKSEQFSSVAELRNAVESAGRELRSTQSELAEAQGRLQRLDAALRGKNLPGNLEKLKSEYQQLGGKIAGLERKLANSQTSLKIAEGAQQRAEKLYAEHRDVKVPQSVVLGLTYAAEHAKSAAEREQASYNELFAKAAQGKVSPETADLARKNAENARKAQSQAEHRLNEAIGGKFVPAEVHAELGKAASYHGQQLLNLKKNPVTTPEDQKRHTQTIQYHEQMLASVQTQQAALTPSKTQDLAKLLEQRKADVTGISQNIQGLKQELGAANARLRELGDQATKLRLDDLKPKLEAAVQSATDLKNTRETMLRAMDSSTTQAREVRGKDGKPWGLELQRASGDKLLIDRAGQLYLRQPDASLEFDDKGGIKKGALPFANVDSLGIEAAMRYDLPAELSKSGARENLERLKAQLERSDSGFTLPGMLWDSVDQTSRTKTREALSKAIDTMKTALDANDVPAAQTAYRQALIDTLEISKQYGMKVGQKVDSLETAIKALKLVNEAGELAAVGAGYIKGGNLGAGAAGATYKFVSALAQQKPLADAFLDGVRGMAYGMHPAGAAVTTGGAEFLRHLTHKMSENGVVGFQDLLTALGKGSFEGALHYLVGKLFHGLGKAEAQATAHQLKSQLKETGKHLPAEVHGALEKMLEGAVAKAAEKLLH